MNVESNTLLLYLIICFNAWAFGTLSQYRNKKINKLFFFAAFFLYGFFMHFQKLEQIMGNINIFSMWYHGTILLHYGLNLAMRC